MHKKDNNASLTLGVDLGGTKIEASLVDIDGQIITSQRILTQPEKGPDGIIADIVHCINKCLGAVSKSAKALGIASAGQIEKDSGIVRFSPNLGWHNVPLRARLEEELEMPVIVTNDVRAATYGEWRYGAGKGVDDLVCLFVGTGVGGSVVSGGTLLEGCTNSAGELGHITIVADGRQCRCHNRGCLEAYVGGWAIAERAQSEVRSNPKAGQSLIELAGSIDQISAATVTKAYTDGDSLAQRIVGKTAQFMAAGLVGIVNAFNPCLLILGGGVIHGLPQYIALAEPILRLNALTSAVENLHISPATMGNKAGVIGAAALANNKLQQV